MKAPVFFGFFVAMVLGVWHHTGYAQVRDCIPPPDQLVAWWPMDDPAGVHQIEDIIADPVFNNGVLTGPLPSVPGKVQTALQFDGSTWVRVYDHPSLDFGDKDEFTIDFWLLPRAQQNYPQWLLRKVDSLSPNIYVGYEVYLIQNRIGLGLGSAIGGYDYVIPAPTLFNGEWHHVAIVVRRDTAPLHPVVTFFIDGNLHTTIPTPAGHPGISSLENAADLSIGEGYMGRIDELEIFRRGLQEKEIRDIADAGSAGKCKSAECKVQGELWFQGTDSLTGCCRYELWITNHRSDVWEITWSVGGAQVVSYGALGPTQYAALGVFKRTTTPYPIGTNPIGYFCLQQPPGGSGIFTVTILFRDRERQVVCKQTLRSDIPCIAENPVDSCHTNELVLNTGYDPMTATALPVGVPDPYWIVVSDPLPGTIEPRPATTIQKYSSWAGPLTNSRWIAVYGSSSNNVNGTYVYRRCVCADSSGVGRLKLEVYADDTVAVFWNGQKIGSRGAGAYLFPALVIDTILAIVQGENCLEIVVENTGQYAHGLNVAGSLTSALHGSLRVDSCCNPRAWIQGQKFFDFNCNGQVDPGDFAFPGWTIQALSATGITYSGVTGSDGWYNISVPPGTYTVSEIVQPGYTPSAGGPYVVTVQAGDVVQYDFLNCTSTQVSCDTLGQVTLDSSCCAFTLPIFLADPADGISQINWSLSGGTMESILSIPCPPMLTPNPPFGAVSGSIAYSTPCVASPVSLTFEVTPTLASGVVTLVLEIIHVSGQVCYDTVQLHCARAPITRCDSLAVFPFVYPGLNKSGRTFVIHNQKQPPSPIQQVLIQLIPDPFPQDPNFKWDGGGLLVDGNSRNWSVFNSGSPYYSRIEMDCGNNPNAPQGLAANNTVRFNLGVDYTLNWVGSVVLTIIHCDGDTCQVTYDPWCAKRDPQECWILDTIPLIQANIFLGNLIGGAWTIRDVKQEVCYVVIAVDPKIREAKAVEFLSGSLLLPQATSELLYDSTQRRVVGIRLWKPCYYPTDSIPLTAMVKVAEGVKQVPLQVMLYDRNANPISDTIVNATIPVTGMEDRAWKAGRSELRLIPNPALEEVRLEFMLTQPGWVVLTLVDAKGAIIGRWREYYGMRGKQYMGVSTRQLSAGSYVVQLQLPGGVILTAPLTIVR